MKNIINPSLIGEAEMNRIEGYIWEYGYSKTIDSLNNIDQYGLAQFVLGLYLTTYHYQPSTHNLWRG